ncbi:hypothetical protein LDENG_00061120 [Lucifuga dentata]|nr:hypothetical protein LDENG_00061120 [Lucifuga dentata]
MSSDTLVVAALGRPFTLGMLYDGLRDKLVPGVTLWDETILSENTDESRQSSSTFEVTASDTTKAKSTMLNVEASLKASFLCGLVEVEGSAKYLNNKKSSRNQSRVTLQYKVTTSFKQLLTNINTKGMQNTHILDKQMATHVVMGILYGANAFFVFDSEKVEATQVQDIQGSMQAAIKKIPTAGVEGGASVQLTTEEQAITNKFSCRFHGDFVLDSNPTTFKDAIVTYQQLPQLLGKDGENTVPVKVWLMPLTHFYSRAAVLVSDITTGILRKAQNALEDIDVILMRCNDCLDDKAAHGFPEIESKIKDFKRLTRDYSIILQQDISEILPEIQKGTKEMSALNDIFEKRNMSPFSHESLGEWMDAAEREDNVFQVCLNMMEGIKVVKSRSELDRNIFGSHVKEAVCFVFTAVKEKDPFLSVLSDYLCDYKSGNTKEFDLPTYNQWYFSKEDVAAVREKARVFSEFAKNVKDNKDVLCLVAAVPNDKHKGAAIYYYKEGFLSNEHFSVPHVPAVDTITDRALLLWYSRQLTLNPKTAHKSLSLSNGNKKAMAGKDQWYRDSPERFDCFRAVLCQQALSERTYWEVDCSQAVELGVAYKSIGRKGWGKGSVMGRNLKSWSFGVANGMFMSNYGNSQLAVQLMKSFKRVGVFLDWYAGTLSYYDVSDNTLTHFFTFKIKFTEPVYPGFIIGTRDYVAIV